MKSYITFRRIIVNEKEEINTVALADSALCGIVVNRIVLPFALYKGEK